MLVGAILGSLPMAVGIALSPIPVAAVMMILMSSRAGSNGPAFLLGWILGILTVGFAVFIIPGIETARGEPTALAGLIMIVLGIAFLLWSVRYWRQRAVSVGSVQVPKVLAHLDQLGVTQSTITGFMLTGVNPKNLFLCAAGAATIDASMLEPGAQVTALLLFAVIASLTIAVPVAVYFLARRSAEAMFGRWKYWLIENNATMILVLLPIFGVLLIGRGIKIVTA